MHGVGYAPTLVEIVARTDVTVNDLDGFGLLTLHHRDLLRRQLIQGVHQLVDLAVGCVDLALQHRLDVRHRFRGQPRSLSTSQPSALNSGLMNSTRASVSL